MKLSRLSRSISEKCAIVTGAGSGMGRATARLFADEGAKVAITDINHESLKEVEREILDAGHSVKAWTLDVSNKAEIEKVIPQIATHFGGIDILINNAGIGGGGAIDSNEFVENWTRAFAVLVTGHAWTIRTSVPYLRKSDSPRIVNIASTEGLGATKGNAPYTAAKTSVIGLTRSLAVDLGSEGITVNCICPGPVRTGMTSGIPENNKAEYARRRIALKRYADPEEVAHMTLSLVLPAASFTTGVALPVDGGLTIKNA